MPACPPVAARASDLEAIEGLHALAEGADGHASLGEAVWRDLDRPSPGSAGFLVREPPAPTGARDDASAPIGYVHVARSDTFSPRHWAFGLVVRPECRGGDTARSLLDVAVAHVASQGGGSALLWIFDPSPDDDALAAATGFEAERDVLQMRASLPLGEEPLIPAGIEIRDFEPGRDDAEWLAVNNRAFGNHPEQGGWIEETLRRRMAEPWFDPSLFLLALDSRGIAGFNWCKVHEGHGRDPALGEIFVIGVDPRAQGTGLGRALALAGLARLASRGIRTGMLFVAADNVAARSLYEQLGFTVHRVDRAYRGEVAER